MKIHYTFTVIRYVHDAVSGEFANVGIILYSPSAAFVRSLCTTSYHRLSQFFGRVEGDYVRSLLKHIERQTNALHSELFDKLTPPPDDAAGVADLVLPRDDSALQVSPVAGGLAGNLEIVLERLYERYVNRYRSGSDKSTRRDEEVLPLFKAELEAKNLLSHMQPKLISAPDYDHEFPIAWKNGIWNTCDAVSLDLASSGDILEKANKWLGRVYNLKESTEPFRLVLLVGEPHRDELAEATSKAENILRKSPVEIELIPEQEAYRLAELVARDLYKS